jgi:hypothetical protein
MVNILTPGAGWLAKFLPVFFVPGLAMLPVAPSVGSFVEVSRIAFCRSFLRLIFRCCKCRLLSSLIYPIIFPDLAEN